MSAGSPACDVLVPSAGRPGALAVTLTGLLAQQLPLRVVISDQTSEGPAYEQEEIVAVLRVLRLHGAPAELHFRPERLGIAEQRAFLLSRARTPYALFLDDDVLLGPGALARMLTALRELDCGLVGMAPQGLSYAADIRPDELADFEPWTGPVLPERIRKGSPGWERWRLHNAANLVHLARAVEVPERGWVPYRIAWVGGCVLYRTEALRACGGYDFWPELPAGQRGEDVVAQLRVMERYGAAGLLPSAAYHLEVPTTMTDRQTDAYETVLERADRLTTSPMPTP